MTSNWRALALFYLSQSLPSELDIVRSQHGIAYSRQCVGGNPYAVPVGSRQLDNTIRQLAQERGIPVRITDIREINAALQAYAETAGALVHVWYRVAPYGDGVEIDLGEETHTHVRVVGGVVETIHKGSPVLFYRPKAMRPMAPPGETGDLTPLLNRLALNLRPSDAFLLLAWITYTLAHPKVPTNKYPLLVLKGMQGSGKTVVCNILLRLLDPNEVGVQTLSGSIKEFAVSARHSHVLCFDNVRSIRWPIADVLCIAATGGATSARQLYTDAEQYVLRLHCACVLNGIHSFVNQSDLAQRCLPLELRPIPEEARQSESTVMEEFESNLPSIMRGLFEVIAGVQRNLPCAEVTKPQRMMDFVIWLAAMEKADGVTRGTYQALYSDALNGAQLDSLLDNPLAAAVLEFAEQCRGHWSGAPAELFAQLSSSVPSAAQRSPEWPSGPISLSKRLAALEGPLRGQGIFIAFGRGKRRHITITVGARDAD